MKLACAGIFVAAMLVVMFGSPIAGAPPLRAHYYESPEPILPMSFAHLDHAQENCILCHHNYVDDTGGGLCMTCHVTVQEVWPLLEQQFHELCRGCHADKAAQGIDGGPPRQCMACHRGDELP